MTTRAAGGAGKARLLFKFPGGKSALVSRLLELAGAPVQGRYVEPFVGGGAVLGGVLGLDGTSALASRGVAWDASPAVRQAWRAVKDEPEELAGAMVRLQERYAEAVEQGAGKSFFFSLRRQLGALLRDGWGRYTATTTAHLFLAYTRLTWNGVWRVNAAGEPNVAWNGAGRLTVPDGELVGRWSTALRDVEIPGEGSWRALVEGVGDGDLLYLDPPYAPLPGDPKPRKGLVQYTPEPWRPGDHAALLEAAAAAGRRGARVLVSAGGGSWTQARYEDAGFEVFLVGERRSVNRDGAGRGAVDCLIGRWRG